MERIYWLDTFRGILIIIALLCKDVSTYWNCLFHTSTWDGFKIADMLPGLFLYISGISLTISSRKKCIQDELTRLLLLFFIGLVLEGRQNENHLIDLSTIRIPGTLQRLSISSIPLIIINFTCCNSIRPLISISIALCFLLLYYFLAYNVHGCAFNSQKWSPTCNSAINIDSFIFGLNHLFTKPTYITAKQCSSTTPCAIFSLFAPAYCRRSFDPYGIMSTINASVTILFASVIHHPNFYIGWKRNLISFLLFCIVQVELIPINIPINSSLNTPTYVFHIISTATTITSILETWTNIPIIRFVFSPINALGKNSLMFFILGGTGLVEDILRSIKILPSLSALDMIKKSIAVLVQGKLDPSLSYVFVKLLIMVILAIKFTDDRLYPFQTSRSRRRSYRLGSTL